jgi:hypothetical protein
MVAVRALSGVLAPDRVPQGGTDLVDWPAAQAPAQGAHTDEREVTEVEIYDRRTDADIELRFRYASAELVERMAQAMAAMSTENGRLTLAGLTFDVMLVEAEVQPQFEGDVLKLRGRLRPSREATQ